MATKAYRLASGPGWEVNEVLCSAGPGDRPFEEQHDAFCIAAVLQGTFRYRSSQGRATLVPGAVLLGNSGTCFECGHEHSRGDRCIAFHLSPQYLEGIVATVPGARRLSFDVPRLPPSAALTPVVAAVEGTRADALALEETTLDFAGAVIAGLADAESIQRPPSARDERRITETVKLIEARAHEPLNLTGLSSEGAMSPYHFLRTFRAVVGATPYQFVLGLRLRHAAVKLRQTDQPISAIAYEAGFGDLSEFNRRFRRIMGTTPTRYRGRSPRTAMGTSFTFAKGARTRASAS